MIATFAAYDALNNPVPREERNVVSSFHCDVDNYVLGVWVKTEGTQVIPLYLTQEQIDNLTQETPHG